jgi:ubiquinone/menaquinone biosynthesis C-methylase UbiE
MSESDSAFVGSIPAIYDRYLGPLIFADYAADMARRAVTFGPRSVLETAAGTGIVTRALASALPADVAITATDLNQPMLDYAAARPGTERVSWRQADAQNLPFADESFDVVVCQFGIMFFPDKAAGYREAWRVLRADGRFLVSVWDSLAENEIPAAVSDAVAAQFPGDPPQFLARTPYVYHDLGAIKRALHDAGFSRVEAETLDKCSRAPSSRDPAVGFCHGSPMRAEIEARAPGRLDEVTDKAAASVASRFGDGAIEGKIKAHIFTAYR